MEYYEAWTLQDLIGLLSQRIFEPADFIRCAAVCEVWRSSFAEYKPSLEPWLMSVDRKDSDVRDFYNLLNGKTLSFSLPEAHRRFFFPTNYGWVFTLGLDLEIHLLHPLSRIQIPLPAADKFTDKSMLDEKEWMRSVFIENVCLSSDPRENDCVVMVTYSGVRNLALARLGDSSWTDIELPYPCYNDLMFFQGKFYAIRRNGLLVACDIGLSKPRGTVVAKLHPPRPDGDRWGPDPKYLVQSSGNILVVARTLHYTWKKRILGETFDQGGKLIDYYTTKFEVYKLQQNGESEKMDWSRVMDLGDCALFLGRNFSISISTRDNDWIRRNCIYFTDDSLGYYDAASSKTGYDHGIFCLNDGKIERGLENLPYPHYVSPGWIQFSRFNL